MIIVVMGVCSSGKTVIGRLLAQRIGLSFCDTDDF
jgi:shikimate kinase